MVAAVFVTRAFPLASGSERMALSPDGPSRLNAVRRFEKDKLVIFSAVYSVRADIGIAFLTCPASYFHCRYRCTSCEDCGATP